MAPALVSLFLERSADSPLHVAISDSGIRDESQHYRSSKAQQREMLLELFYQSHSQRVTSLTVEVGCKQYLGGFFNGSRRPPNLSQLKFMSIDWDFEEDSPKMQVIQRGISRMLTNTPCLSIARIPLINGCTDPYLANWDLCLPKWQIKSLIFRDDINTVDRLQVLEAYPNAKKLRIECFSLTHGYRVYGIEFKMFNHYNLTDLFVKLPEPDELELGQVDYQNYSTYLLFKVVTLPSLKSIVLVCPQEIGGLKRATRAWDGTAFQEMVKRSACRVENLALVNIHVNSSDIRVTFLAAPNLLCFTLYDVTSNVDGHSSTESTLECLMNFADGAPRASRLEELRVSFELPAGLPDAEIATREIALARKLVMMMEAREQHGLRALKIALRVRRPLLQSTREVFDDLREGAVESISVTIGEQVEF
ncbi:hypothetical protein V5O48_014972 [Marasmius crinis-equi]|uniref:Uncharacterized protein n=1 Tax=Marasmius crinis-equi TaxID=585013 RepID=A0ABR3EW44_9AGAR